MTICLPIDPSHFRREFDDVCERIRRTEQDPNFFDLLTALVANFRQHPLFVEFIQDLDAQSRANQEAYNLHLLGVPINPVLKDSHKQEYMQRLAIMNAPFCWDRLCFLWQLGDPNTGENQWTRVARQSLASKFALPPRPSLDSILPIEYQIHRKDYDGYLSAWQNHVHTQLVHISTRQQSKTDCLWELPATQKENFVIDLARKFWNVNPVGNRDAAFSYYTIQCPHYKLLGRDRWNQIVRKRQLDPRQPEERKRGPGKKRPVKNSL